MSVRSAAAPATAQLVAAVQAVHRSGVVAPLRPLATPWVLDVDLTELDRSVAQLVGAVSTLLERWHAGALASQMPALAQIRGAAHRDMAAKRALLFTRLDVVCPPEAPEQFQLLEVQAGDPSAMGFADALSQASAPHVSAQPMWLARSHRQTLERGVPPERRSIAFSVQRGSLVETDHRLLAAEYAAHGWRAVVVDPSEFEFSGGRLLARGEAVEVVFRDAIDELLAGGTALLAAHEAGAVLVTNPFSAAFADDKGWLEPLSVGEGFDAQTAALLRAHVPWTRLVASRDVEWRSERWPLEKLLRARREDFVLKPCDGYGGFGVVVGASESDARWQDAVGGAFSGAAQGRSFVAQQFVPLPRQRVSVLNDEGGATDVDCHVVHSLWCHGARLAGAFMRASQNPVVNVHQGGGLAPCFFAAS